MSEKKLILTFVGYEIRGVADVSPWGGGNGAIEMRPFMTDSIEKKDLLPLLNDAGFGVESINGGICNIYEVYADMEGTKAKKFLKTTTVGKVSKQTREFEEQV